MVVRVKVRLSGPSARRRGQWRSLALVLAAFLSPASLMAFALAFWRLGADLRWTDAFVIQHGLFSHWQVWIAVGVVLQMMALGLNRLGHSGEEVQRY